MRYNKITRRRPVIRLTKQKVYCNMARPCLLNQGNNNNIIYCNDRKRDCQATNKIIDVSSTTNNNYQSSVLADKDHRRLVTLTGQQCHHDVGPLLPPSNFKFCSLYNNGMGDGRIESVDEAKRLVFKLKKHRAYRRTHRKYIRGVFYEKMYDGCRYIDTRDGSRVELNIRLADGVTTTSVKIASAMHMTSMLGNIVDLGEALKSNSGNVRNKAGDKGKMFGLGHRDFIRDVLYCTLFLPGVSVAMAWVTKNVGRYMRKFWPDEFEEIREMETKKSTATVPLPQMGGLDGPGNSIMMSRNLANSAHLDVYDNSRSFSIWAEKKPGNATNWYFIMPDVSLNGSRGVAVRLHHGCVICWDGRLIRHCTSLTNVDQGNSVYACMFGSCGGGI